MEDPNNAKKQAQEAGKWRTRQAKGPRSSAWRYPAPLILQLSIIHGYSMATMDLKSAYLNAPLPPVSDWIIITLEYPRPSTGVPYRQCSIRPPRLWSYILPALPLSAPLRRVHHVRVRQLPLLPYQSFGNDLRPRLRRRYLHLHQPL